MKKILLLLTLCIGLMAESFSIESSVKVFKSEPHYSNIVTEIPYDECHDEREETGGNSVGGAVVGGALGGVLGHQVGGGSGKTAATIGGAVLGTILGGNAASTPKGYNIVRKCRTLYKQSSSNQLDGYINYAKLNGNTISVNSSDRLDTIPVTITFSY